MKANSGVLIWLTRQEIKTLINLYQYQPHTKNSTQQLVPDGRTKSKKCILTVATKLRVWLQFS